MRAIARGLAMHLFRSPCTALALFLTACQGGGSNDASTGESASTADDSATTAGPAGPTTSADPEHERRREHAEIPTSTTPTTDRAPAIPPARRPTAVTALACWLSRRTRRCPGPGRSVRAPSVFNGLTLEVWYPATPGSEADMTPIEYDIRSSLPDSEQAKVPDESNPWQPCDCYRDLPLDADHGPYPTVIFIHGTAGFRSQSLEQVTHWASRGFVVLAADHPGLWLHDLLGQLCGVPAPPQNLAADLATIVGGIKAPVGELAFLAGPHRPRAHRHGRTQRRRQRDQGRRRRRAGVHPDGGRRRVPRRGPQVDADHGRPGRSGRQLRLAGPTATPTRPRASAWSASANAGHLAFSSLCSLRNAADQDFLEIAAEFDVCGAQFAGALFDCSDTYTPDATNWAITNYATSAALEETLHCSDAGANFASIQSKFPEVGEFLEAL
jgi:hypothetical protein